jgi:integrase
MRGKSWIMARPNGTFTLRFRDDRGRTRSEGTFKTREEAEQAKATLDVVGSATASWFGTDERTISRGARSSLVEHLMDTGQAIPPEMLVDAEPGDAAPGESLAEYLDGWIRGDRSLRDTSRRNYLGVVRNHVAGTPLGRTDIRRITPRMIEEFWASLDPERTGVMDQVEQVLSKAFRRALRHRDIDVNPLERTELVRPRGAGPRRVRGNIQREDLRKLAAAASCERDRLAIELMAWCGLRAGEVGGLRVDGLDAVRCELAIEQQVTRATGGSKLGPPKTRRSTRVVGLPSSLCRDLAAFVADSTDELIFRSDRGGLWSDSPANIAVKRAAKAANLPGVHAHLLRHLAGSMALESGASVAEVAEMLGDTIGVVQETYLEALSGGRARIAAASEASRERFRNAE